MTPVARLILVRSVDRRELINAMVWVTLPALIGPLLGPPLGGFITTYISWHWIFLINIPIGLVGIVLATIFIEDVRAETPDPFDALGVVLAGLGIGGLVFGGSLLGLNLLPIGVVHRADLSSAPSQPTPMSCTHGARPRRCSISRCSSSRPCAPPWSAASFIAPASGRCRSCFRFCSSSALISLRSSPA